MRKKLGFGLMRLPATDPKDPGKIDIKETCDMVDMYLDRGFDYFDTAWMYCNFKSEDAVKDILTSRHARDKYTITTELHSGFINTKEDRDKIFDTQRKKMGTDFLDYYWLHDVNTHSIEVYDKLDCWSWIQDKKKAGDVRHIGFSFHDGPELLDKVLTEHPEFEYVQLQINYLDWESAGVRSGECYEVATKHGKPVIVMEPVKGGTLASLPEEAEKLMKDYAPDASIPSWAIRYVSSLENVYMVLSGMSNMAQMDDNTSFMKDFVPLNQEERAIIDKVVGILNKNIAIPCTGCAYCAPGCPMNINIPRYFSLYNAEMQEVDSKGWTPQGEYYDNLTKEFGKASECIGCGQCEGICPQHLPIIDNLKLVAEKFESK